jgi:hypothetical protein
MAGLLDMMVNPVPSNLGLLPSWLLNNQAMGPQVGGFNAPAMFDGLTARATQDLPAGFPTDFSSQARPPAMPMQLGPQMPDAGPQMQQQQQMPQGGGFFDRLGAGLGANSNTLLSMGAALLGGKGWGGAAEGAMSGRKLDQDRATAGLTEQALIKHGLSPDVAKVVSGNPALLAAVMQQRLGLGGQTDDIKEFEYAKRQGFTGTLTDWMQRKRSTTAGKYGLTPVFGTDKDGKPAIIQLGNEGQPIQPQLPEGFQIARDPIKVEGPTGTALLDPQTRQQIGFVPKDVAGAARQKEIGEAEGQAAVNLPTAIATAENTLKTIEQMKNHPGKKNWGAFGVGAMLPDMPGSSTRGFGAFVDQIKGQNFMTAFQSLKGAGAITEQEGAKAERAQARLDRAQSEADFDAAIKDLEDVVRSGMARARQKAGGGAPTAAGAGAAPSAPRPDPLGLR